MRDAIVFSGWTWETFGAPERISLALAHLGCKVLHCATPVSVLRNKTQSVREVGTRIHSLQLRFVSSRLNAVPGVPNLQASMLRRQIQAGAKELGLRDPLFLYAWLGGLFPLCTQMKLNHFVVHICMDHSVSVDPHYDRFVEASDKTLAIPKSSFHKFRAKFGDKVEIIPQVGDFTRLTRISGEDDAEPVAFAGIPRPRLGFFGNAHNLNLPVLQSLLAAHPNWQFVSSGKERAVPLSNSHSIPWANFKDLRRSLLSIDVGFMPYNCYDEERLHGVPLKLLEYFALGLPVVSTPLIHLWEYKDLIYFGDTAEELSSAVKEALNEPFDSPKRTTRIEIASCHSIENLAEALRGCLPLGGAVTESVERSLCLKSVPRSYRAQCALTSSIQNPTVPSL